MERSNAELADRLEDQKCDIEKIGFTLELLTGSRGEIDRIVYRVNSWIDDACAALRNSEPYKPTVTSGMSENGIG